MLLIWILVIGGIAINIWMSHREKVEKRRRGFDVKLNTADPAKSTVNETRD